MGWCVKGGGGVSRILAQKEPIARPPRGMKLHHMAGPYDKLAEERMLHGDGFGLWVLGRQPLSAFVVDVAGRQMCCRVMSGVEGNLLAETVSQQRLHVPKQTDPP